VVFESCAEFWLLANERERLLNPAHGLHRGVVKLDCGVVHLEPKQPTSDRRVHGVAAIQWP
jgi:hypothetical protein